MKLTDVIDRLEEILCVARENEKSISYEKVKEVTILFGDHIILTLKPKTEGEPDVQIS